MTPTLATRELKRDAARQAARRSMQDARLVRVPSQAEWDRALDVIAKLAQRARESATYRGALRRDAAAEEVRERARRPRPR